MVCEGSGGVAEGEPGVASELANIGRGGGIDSGELKNFLFGDKYVSMNVSW